MTAAATELFGFSHRPFRGTPDPQDYVSLDAFEQEIAGLAEAAVRGDGIAVLTAAPGTGKTLVCLRLQSELREQFQAVVLSSSGFATRRALLQAVMFALGQPYEGLSEQELRLSVLGYARAAASSHDGIVLIVDEAHLLNARLLEELRCLTNHSQGGRPLMRVVLCGQLPLEETLVSPALEALNYRITCHSTLEPLSMRESARLVAGRLIHAGSSAESVFTPEALETICRVSDGNPRCLVQLCDESLCVAASTGEVPASVESVRLALHDLKALPLQWNESAVDQPQSTAGTDVSEPLQTGEEVAGESIGSQAQIEPVEDLPIDEDAVSDAAPAWSNSVTTVEVGARCADEAAETAADWTSFEPDQAVDDCVGELEPDSPVETATVVEFSSPDEEPDEGLQADEQPQVAGSIAQVLTDIDEDSGEFVELSVDDVYASLDHSTGPGVSGVVGDIDEMLREMPVVDRSAEAPPPEERKSPWEASADVEESNADPSVDSVEGVEEMIAELAGERGESAAESLTQSDLWQSAGDCRQYDVVEPSHDRREDSAEIGSTDFEADAAHGMSRPYARLFSRARKERV